MNLIQCLRPDGSLTQLGEEVWGQLTKEEKLQFFYWMGFTRTFDRKCILLQRQGRIGTYPPFEGQEASQVGAVFALDKEDWLFPTYRDHAATITFGMPLKQVLFYWMGRVEGNTAPNGLKIMPPCVPISSQIPQAVGAAWASKLRGESSVAVAFFGDGATSAGDFHEGCNFAGVFQLPVILFCQNNGYAISVPFSRQSASPTVAEKASIYHFPGYRVDGNDILAVYHVMKQAVKKARAGEGATLIEAVTYRKNSHTTADDASRYRPQEEVSEWVERKDPLTRYQQLLLQQQVIDENKIKNWQEEWKQEVELAVKEAESAIPAPPSHLFEHVFAELPPSLQKQRVQWINEVKSL